jgi:molybdenum cofactor biosynthesis enzyme MoaA
VGVIQQIKGYFTTVFSNEENIPMEYQSYYKSRIIKDKTYICHAPFSNMYFNSLGDVANCWLTFDQPEKYSEDKTILDIWNGERFSQLRDNIKNFDLEKRCQKCNYYIKNSNFTNALSKAYDNDYPLGEFPTMMEFELSNTCNLECTMCTGLLSSSIRANREHLPVLKSPYGAKFVNELKEFIPHLHEARFNGGEPFLIKIYYDIWDQFIDLNPNCRMVIATNGTTLNKRAKTILEKGNFHINLSIDSLIPERYSEIRVNGQLDKVLENFLYFKEYCQKNGRSICIMINPMRNNWEEMPEFVRFCNQHNVHLWFNSIMYPEDLSLWKLPYEELKEIYTKLSNTTFEIKSGCKKSIYKYNVETYKNLVFNQIKTWMEDAQLRLSDIGEIEKISIDIKKSFIEKLKSFEFSSQISNEIRNEVLDKILHMEVRLNDPDSIQKMYQILYQSPIDIVVENIKENDIDVLLQKIKTAM